MLQFTFKAKFLQQQQQKSTNFAILVANTINLKAQHKGLGWVASPDLPSAYKPGTLPTAKKFRKALLTLVQNISYSCL